MAQTKAQLVVGLNVNASAPASALQIDASGNVNLDSNTLYVDATNNRVGIGTSSPGSLLTVKSPGAATTFFNCENSSGTSILRLFQTAGGSGRLIVSDSTGTDFFNVQADQGRVGIGISSPTTTLDVAGNARLHNSTSNTNRKLEMRSTQGYSSFIQFTEDNIADRWSLGIANGDGGFIFKTGADFTGTERLRITSAGNVGIGTTSPNNKLEVVGAGYFTDWVYTGSGSGSRGISSDSSTRALLFGVNGSEVGRFDTSGRLLVGTSSSLATYLTQINFAGASTNGLYINSSSTSGDGSTMLALGRASTPNNTVPVITYTDSTAGRFELRNNGGLANYQANNVNLSDRNTKKDITPAAGTWDCIKEWEIVNYRYKDQPDDADLNLGVIAQQVAESCPEVITVFQEAKEATEDQPAQEERLGVKEQQMYWMAIKALQEAQVRIEQLEAKVAALESA